MPKPKPDQVIRHEIVLGRSERDLLDSALIAYGFNRVATPTVALLSDVSAMTFIFSIVGGYFGIKYVVSPGLTEVGEIYDDFRNQLDAARAAGVEIDVAGIATNPSTYTNAFLEGLDTIFGR